MNRDWLADFGVVDVVVVVVVVLGLAELMMGPREEVALLSGMTFLESNAGRYVLGAGVLKEKKQERNY